MLHTLFRVDQIGNRSRLISTSLAIAKDEHTADKITLLVRRLLPSILFVRLSIGNLQMHGPASIYLYLDVVKL